MSERPEKKLTKSDLLRCFLIWETTSESCLSYERLMSLGFCHAMAPIINRLYQDKEDRVAALKRHMVFFNTENNWGAFIPGIVCSMEEEKANGGSVSDEMINSVKIGLMGRNRGYHYPGIVKDGSSGDFCGYDIEGKYCGTFYLRHSSGSVYFRDGIFYLFLRLPAGAECPDQDYGRLHYEKNHQQSFDSRTGDCRSHDGQQCIDCYALSHPCRRDFCGDSGASGFDSSGNAQRDFCHALFWAYEEKCQCV